MRALPSGRFRAPVNGGHLAYRIVGQGAPMATTHPYATPKAGHGPVPGLTTITVWPRGFGDSAEARDHRDYGFWRLSEDLDAVRQHLGLPTWSFWGTSMAGFVGLIYALQFPDTLSALILDSTAPSHHYKDDPSSIYPTIRDSDAFHDLLAEPSWETLRGYFVLRSRLEGYADPEGMWEQGLLDRDLNPDAHAEIMRRLEAFDTQAQLSDTRILTLILAGEHAHSARHVSLGRECRAPSSRYFLTVGMARFATISQVCWARCRASSGHNWEVVTVSYARQKTATPAASTSS